MEMDRSTTILHVITHENPSGLSELIRSVEENADSSPGLCVVDDSKTERRRRENRRVVNRYCGESCYVDSPGWNALVRRLTPHVDSAPRRELLTETSLGADGWNAPAARRVSHLLASVVLDGSSYLFLDDDMRFRPDTSLDGLADLDPGLAGLRLRGAFDLSHMEWLALFNRYVLRRLDGGDAFADSSATTIYDDDYVARLHQALSRDDVHDSIARYTTLLDRVDRDVDVSFPERSQLNGAAYLCSEECVKLGYHPPWCGEDWSWFEYVIGETSDPETMDISLVHDSDRKDILNESSVRLSVSGSFVTYASRLYARGSSLADLPEVRRTRIAQLERELEITRVDGYGRIADVSPEAVRDGVRTAIRELRSLSLPEVRRKIERFYRCHEEWERLLRTLDSADVEPAVLRDLPH